MKTLQQYCRQFNLAGIGKTFEDRIREAQENNLGYSEFLELLFQDEDQNRDENRKTKRYKEAKFPLEKRLEDFEFSFQPELKKGEILELASCRFLRKGDNIIFIGQPGTGKTHLSIALGIKALTLGYTVLFTSVHYMITTLQQSRADLAYQKKLELYNKPDLLILDELGYKSMGETTVEDFFEIVSRRYDKKAMIITSNREFAQRDKIFLDKTLTGAIIDRIIHHCHTFTIKGESYRFKARNTQQTQENA